jgi:chitinase
MGRALALAFALLLCNVALSPPCRAATPPHVLAGYFCGACATPVATIPADVLTDVIYAFGEPGNGNVCHAADTYQQKRFAELRSFRDAHPSLRLLISIGGWGAAPQFSDAALTPASRAAFARSCIAEYVERDGFDGIDIDWEFPVRGGLPQNPHRPQDRENVTLLLRELRRQLDALGSSDNKHYFLTVATPTGRWQEGGAYDPGDSYDLASVAACVDWLNVMTYDMNNRFSPVSAFNTPMYEDPRDPTPAAERRWNNVTGAVQYYESHGVPADKIVLGMAFYGHGFTGVSSANAGLYSTYSGTFPEIPWSVVKARFLTDPEWQRHWSATAQAPWLYNARTHVFFSYDDPRSMALKGAFVRSAHLRGAMFWMFGEDDSQNSLLQALAQQVMQ